MHTNVLNKNIHQLMQFNIHTRYKSRYQLFPLIYNNIPTSCPFGSVLISDQLQYNVNNLYIVLIFFLIFPSHITFS